MTVKQWIDLANRRLSDQGFDAPKMEAQLLAGHVLLVDRAWLLAHGDEPFPEFAGESLLQRREQGEPLAYLLGSREFYGRRFAVDRRVLIPRHETETLVEAASPWLKPSSRLLDVGAGSGILAITIKLEHPATVVTAIDVSEDALDVARSNAEALGADVRFVHSDGFAGLVGEVFDLIVTNPPYIGASEQLPREVVSYEPHLALFGGPTGLEFYRMLASVAVNHLTADGVLLMEVGYRQSADVRALFAENGWTIAGTFQDLSGVERAIAVQPG